MANITVYDEATGLTKNVSIDVQGATINGSHTGKLAYYVIVSTSSKDPSGNSIPPIVLRDTDFVDSLTDPIKAAVVELFRYMAGEYDFSSSSATSDNSKSSYSRTFGMSSSSQSTQHIARSSSSSLSDLSSLSSISSTYSVHP